MTLAEVKNYLKVDGDEDDSLIEMMMGAAEGYIISAVGRYNDEDARARLLFLACVQDMYDNRQLVAVSSTGYSASQYFRHMVNSLILQLQVEEMMPDPDPDTAPEEEGDGDGV